MRLPMTLWLVPVIPTRLPAASSVTTIRAPLYVLPAPGGPWIGRTVRSSEMASRRAASSSVSAGSRRAAPAAGPPAGAAHQEVAGRPVGTLGVDVVVRDPRPELAEPLAMLGRAEDRRAARRPRGCGAAGSRLMSTVARPRRPR